MDTKNSRKMLTPHATIIIERIEARYGRYLEETLGPETIKAICEAEVFRRLMLVARTDDRRFGEVRDSAWKLRDELVGYYEV